MVKFYKILIYRLLYHTIHDMSSLVMAGMMTKVRKRQKQGLKEGKMPRTDTKTDVGKNGYDMLSWERAALVPI